MDDAALIQVLKAVAHPGRFRMVQEIAAAGELSCGQIGERFPLSQPTVSHHLKILSEAGVVAFRRAGQHGFVSVDRALVREALRLLPGRIAGLSARPRGRARPAARGSEGRRMR